jgi:hypothetical protein
MFIGDVGELATEEVNFIPTGAPPGTNFGWPAYEGLARLPDEPDVAGQAPPALSYPHTAGRCAIVGGYVARGARRRGLDGRYLYGDVCSGRLWSARFLGGHLGTPRPLRGRVPYLVSFGEDAAGRLYAVSFNGPVYRLHARRSLH